jgi:protein-tyrosine phosphatase
MKLRQVKTRVGSLYISPLPMIIELNTGFDLIWNLAYEAADYATIEGFFSKKVICSRIEDCGIPWNVPAFMDDLLTVLKCLRGGGKVLVHCIGGHGRTGMALAMIKHYIDGYSADNALHFSWMTCQGPETYQQDDFVRFVCDNLKDRGNEKRR